MALQDILAGVGAGIKGGLDTYSWQQEQAFKNKELDQTRDLTHDKLQSDMEKADLLGQIKTLVATIGAGARTDVANTTQSGLNTRWGTQSANNKATTDTTQRGQDKTFELGKQRDATTRSGQEMNFNLGTQRDNTTRRGQNLTFDAREDATAAQDPFGMTTRRSVPVTPFDASAPKLDMSGASRLSATLPATGAPETAPTPAAPAMPPPVVLKPTTPVTPTKVGGTANASAAQAVAPAPAAAAVAGPNDAAIAALPPEAQAQIKALTDGRMAFPTGTALKSPYWQRMLGAVAKYDPSFDTVNYNARSKTRNAFTSGKEAGQVNTLNTSLGHLGELADAIDALGNSGFKPWNWVKNETRAATTGNPEKTNLEVILNRVAPELVQAYRGSGGAEADITRNLQDFSASQTPEESHKALSSTAKLLISKIDALDRQYKQGMGTDKVSVLSDAAKQVLDRLTGGKASAGAGAAMQKEIPGHPGTLMESKDGGKTWTRIK